MMNEVGTVKLRLSLPHHLLQNGRYHNAADLRIWINTADGGAVGFHLSGVAFFEFGGVEDAVGFEIDDFDKYFIGMDVEPVHHTAHPFVIEHRLDALFAVEADGFIVA